MVNFQDDILEALRRANTPVSVLLVNGTRLTGRIGWHDRFVVWLESDPTKGVYKHAISSIVAADVSSAEEVWGNDPGARTRASRAIAYLRRSVRRAAMAARRTPSRSR